MVSVRGAKRSACCCLNGARAVHSKSNAFHRQQHHYASIKTSPVPTRHGNLMHSRAMHVHLADVVAHADEGLLDKDNGF